MEAEAGRGRGRRRDAGQGGGGDGGADRLTYGYRASGSGDLVCPGMPDAHLSHVKGVCPVGIHLSSASCLHPMR